MKIWPLNGPPVRNVAYYQNNKLTLANIAEGTEFHAVNLCIYISTLGLGRFKTQRLCKGYCYKPILILLLSVSYIYYLISLFSRVTGLAA